MLGEEALILSGRAMPVRDVVVLISGRIGPMEGAIRLLGRRKD